MKKIDMTSFGPILDKDQYIDFSENFAEILYKLSKRKVVPTKRRKILVLFSIVDGPSNTPIRITISKTYTYGYLLQLYRKEMCTEFDPSNYILKASTINERLETYKKAGEKRMAWAAYGQYSYLKKMEVQKQKIDAAPEKDREALKKKFQQEHSAAILRIG